jgi:hypothetical protein
LDSNTILLADANIIIDFIKADEDALRIICQSFEILVPRIIIQDEIKQLSIEDAQKIGLKIADAELSQMIEANSGSLRVSFYDKICMILTRDNSWLCISNDKKLHSECDVHNVKIIWGLELLLLSVEKGILSKDRSILCFSRIQSINSRMGKKVEDDFLIKLNNIGLD